MVSTLDVTTTVQGKPSTFKATRMKMSPYLCFSYDNSPEEIACLQALGNHLLTQAGPIVLCGAGDFCNYLLRHVPELVGKVRAVVDHDPSLIGQVVGGVTVIPPGAVSSDIKLAFLCARKAQTRWDMQKQLPPNLQIVTPEVLSKLDWQRIPARAWIPQIDSIYPISVPEIQLKHGLDLILLDCPARNLSLLPNGLAYVHNTLKKTGISFQTVDMDMPVYHAYHAHRIFDNPFITTSTGREMLPDPWAQAGYEVWQHEDVIALFQTDIDDIVNKIVAAAPKILALSIHACNKLFATKVVNAVKAKSPDILILVGGYSCYQVSVGLKAFPECDYMCIGEADNTLGPLVQALARGERPVGLPGVMSRFDTPETKFVEGQKPLKLDQLDSLEYDFAQLDLYRNWDGYQLAPVIASRGCRWSLCTFCAERFFWRVRSPEKVVDEFEYLHKKGFNVFVFNESDLNGRPEILLAICDEIVRRGLKIRLTGQLRIHKNSDKEFFRRLRAAGFISLRFGVDAWSRNTLKLQKKGYTPAMIYQNLRDCSEAGIVVDVNTVVGVPGETEEDVDESIQLMLACKPYIWRHANINPLLLVAGSVYWEEPEKHNIKVHGDLREIMEKYTTIVPDHLWHSEQPYIDAGTRRNRFLRIVRSLQENGVELGDFATEVVKNVESGRSAGLSARPEQMGEFIRTGNERDALVLRCDDPRTSPLPEMENSTSAPKLSELAPVNDAAQQNGASCEMPEFDDEPFVLPDGPQVIPDRSKMDPFENRIQSRVSTNSKSVEQRFVVFRWGDEFLGTEPGKGIEHGSEVAAGKGKVSLFKTLLRTVLSGIAFLKTNRSRVMIYVRRAIAIFKVEGVGSLFARARRHLNAHLNSHHNLVVETVQTSERISSISGPHTRQDAPHTRVR